MLEMDEANKPFDMDVGRLRLVPLELGANLWNASDRGCCIVHEIHRSTTI